MYIPKFITNRIKAEMRELTVGETIALCEIPVQENEKGIGKLLSYVVTETNVSVEQWTVQERYAALVHYIVSKNGSDEFYEDLGYSAFLSDVTNVQNSYEFTEQDDDGESITLEVVPLTGEYIEAMERLVVNDGIAPAKGYGAWVIAAMAAQIRVKDTEDEGVIDELLHARIKQMTELPSSYFDKLVFQWQAGNTILTHLIKYTFSDDGVILLSQPTEEDADISSARFLFRTACNGNTLQIFEKH